MADGEGEDVDKLRAEMKEAIKMLRYAVRDEVDFEQDCEMLIEAEPRVRELLVEGS